MTTIKRNIRPKMSVDIGPFNAADFLAQCKQRHIDVCPDLVKDLDALLSNQYEIPGAINVGVVSVGMLLGSARPQEKTTSVDAMLDAEEDPIPPIRLRQLLRESAGNALKVIKGLENMVAPKYDFPSGSIVEGHTLRNIRSELLSYNARQLTLREALTVVLKAPFPIRPESEEKAHEADYWWRLFMEPFELKGAGRILCMGVSGGSKQLRCNSAHLDLGWTAREKFICAC